MMKRASRARHTLAALLLALCAAHAAVSGQSPRRPAPHRTAVRLVTRETSLGKRPAGEISHTRTVSPDGKRIAFVVKAAGGEAVIVDGVAGKTYPLVTRDPFNESGISRPITFSPEGRRVAYVAALDAAGRGPRAVVLDGREGPAYEYIWTGSPGFSRDGRRFGYNARRGGKWHVVVDGVESSPFDGAGAVMFSPDGSRAAFEARRGAQTLFVVDGIEFAGDDPEGQLRFYGAPPREPRELPQGDKRVVVWDGFRSRPYDEVQDLRLHTGDKRVLTFEARAGDKWFAVINGRESKAYERVGGIRVSPDGARALFTAQEGGKMFVVVDGAEGKRYDAVDSFDARFSPDGRHFAYTATREAGDAYKTFVVVGGAEGREYDSLEHFIYTPEGRLLYLGYRRGEHKTYLVRDGEVVNAYDGVPGLSGFQSSPGGRHTFFRVERPGAETLFIDGDAYVYDEIKNVEFGPGGGRYVFKARKGNGWVMVVDGVESEAYEPDGDRPGKVGWSGRDEIAFSRDGSRLAYVARRGGKDFVVSDGAAGKFYDDVRNLAFTPDGRHVAYTARRGGKSLVVFGGAEGREYDGFLSADGREEEGRLNVEGDRRLSILARRGPELLRVELEIFEE